MLKKVLIALGLLGAGLAALCVVIALRPNTYSVQRSAVMAAPADAVFAQVNDFRAWDAWSPWSKLDPNPKTRMSSPSSGRGATFAWSGNAEIGEGHMEIVESRPGELVGLDQVFVRPFAGKARFTFQLAPRAGGTNVTWSLTGSNGFLGKAMCMVMDMDAMLGKDFERGLANIKGIVERGDKPAGTTTAAIP